MTTSIESMDSSPETNGTNSSSHSTLKSALKMFLERDEDFINSRVNRKNTSSKTEK